MIWISDLKCLLILDQFGSPWIRIGSSVNNRSEHWIVKLHNTDVCKTCTEWCKIMYILCKYYIQIGAKICTDWCQKYVYIGAKNMYRLVHELYTDWCKNMYRLMKTLCTDWCRKYVQIDAKYITSGTFLWSSRQTTKSDHLKVQSLLEPESVHDLYYLHGHHILSEIITHFKHSVNRTHSLCSIFKH